MRIVFGQIGNPVAVWRPVRNAVVGGAVRQRSDRAVRQAGQAQMRGPVAVVGVALTYGEYDTGAVR